MHIRELVARTGISERQVRYLIAEGFMPPPTGGRAMADYGETHVEAVQRYMRLRELGFPPAAIRKLLETKEGAPFPVAPGITLVVDPNLLHRRMRIAPILARLTRILSDIFKEPKNDKTSPRKRD
jgi:DNA-binding transcriptional MerR regulator